ncbi:Leucine Rich Repeat family protein [Trichomonas vaginalis G3]|uniref:Leucine Rich Repeat family protein n=1 Tax=Trichomonas vaginalis (strain ATCC PRA-98 / G3) TaxID=412133 RepID=A2ELU4_TRIV3|nr:uncharacterized protein TVAGG3_0400980 [Trichomonas vaginalis G3]EAY06372.1 Leucine Rich Repeat family protein [Trichomonas vaginalis G3]KAI5534688.1 RNI-like family [Trichomonas vaginalis G3]|eukprot:XP_001318595.1 hypothetical protein [Trichomonas vaginalis G3]
MILNYNPPQLYSDTIDPKIGLINEKTDTVESLPRSVEFLVILNKSPYYIFNYFNNLSKDSIENIKWISIHNCELDAWPTISSTNLPFKELLGIDLRTNKFFDFNAFSSLLDDKITPKLRYFNILDNPVSENTDNCFNEIFRARSGLIQINKIQVVPNHFRIFQQLKKNENLAKLQVKAAIRSIPEDYYVIDNTIQGNFFLSKLTFLDLSGCGILVFHLKLFPNLKCLILRDNEDLEKIILPRNYNSLKYLDLTNCSNALKIKSFLLSKLSRISIITNETENTQNTDVSSQQNDLHRHLIAETIPETPKNTEFILERPKSPKKQNSTENITKPIAVRTPEPYECYDSSNLENNNFLQDNLFKEMLSRISFVVFTNKENKVTAINSIIEEGTFVSEKEFLNKSTIYSQSKAPKPSCEFIVCKGSNPRFLLIKKYLEQKCGMEIDPQAWSEYTMNNVSFELMEEKRFKGYRYAPFNFNLQLLFIRKLYLANLGLGDSDLKMISDSCPFLEHLDLNGNQIQKVDFNGTVLDRLTYLDLGNNSLVEDKANPITNELKRLKSLKFLVIEANFTKDLQKFFQDFRGIKKINNTYNPYPLSPPEMYAVKKLDMNPNNMTDIKNRITKESMEVAPLNSYLTILNDQFTFKDDIFGHSKSAKTLEVSKITSLLDYILMFFEKAQFIRYFSSSTDWSKYPKYIQGITFTLFTYINQIFLFLRSIRLVFPLDNFIEFFWYGLIPLFMMWFMQKHIAHVKLTKFNSLGWHLTFSFAILLILVINEFTYDFIVKGVKFRYQYIWWIIFDLAISLITFLLSRKITVMMDTSEIRKLSNIKEQICLAFIVLMQFPSMEFMFRNMKCSNGYYQDFPSVDCSWKLMPSYAIIFLLFNCFCYYWFFISTIQNIHSNAHKNLELSNKDSYWKSIWHYSIDEIFEKLSLCGTYSNERYLRLKDNFKNYNDLINSHYNPAKNLSEGRSFASSWFIILEFTYRLLVSIDDFFGLKSIFTLISTMVIFVIYILIPSKSNYYERWTDIIFTLGTLFMSFSTIFGDFKHPSASSYTLIAAVVAWIIAYAVMLIGLIISFLPTRLKNANSWATDRWYTGAKPYE